MKKHLFRIVTVAIDLVLFIALSAGPLSSTHAQVLTPIPGDGTIIVRGQVINAPAGARLQAARTDGTLAAETYIGPQGQYAFRPFAAEVYHLDVVDEQGRWLPLTADSQADVRPSTQASRLEYILTVVILPTQAQTTSAPAEEAVAAASTGQISGVVTAADTSLPLAYTTVKAYDAAGVLKGSGFSAYSTGIFSLTGLPTGTYTVYFEPMSGSLYAPEWYNNQHNQASATDVSVTDGLTTPNINASLDVGGQITGTVSAAAGGAPLESAVVYIYSSRTASTYDYLDIAYTNASGVYTFTGLAAGDYYLKYEKTDYLTGYYNNKASLADADAVAVALNTTASGKDVSLYLGGKISGHVTAASGGAPLENVSVYVYNNQTASTYGYVDFAYTDATGLYTFTGLPAGNYYLRFEKTDYLIEYYNNKASLAAADAVSVALNATASGKDASLDLGGKISGHVTAASGGAPLENVSVYAYDNQTASIYGYVDSAYTDATGLYTFTGLQAGNYYLRFEKTDYLIEYYNNKASLAAADAVSVALNATATGKDASLDLGGKISGHVTSASGGAPQQNVTVYVYDSQTASTYDYVEYVTTDATGLYTATGLAAGDYYLKFNPPSASDYLPQYYHNQSKLATANAVSVSLNTVTGNIDAALLMGGKISGRVTAAESGAGLPQVQVSIYGYSLTCGLPGLSVIATTTTDASGYYSVPQLVTGNYFAYFLPLSYGVSASYLDEYYNDKTSLDTADPIGVTTGQITGSIDTALTLGGTINGQVTALDGGASLEDVYVDVYNSQTGNWENFTSTDSSGAYSVTALPAGNYKVEFDPSTSGPAFAYIGEYYNDKATYSSADLVNVTAGAVVNGIDAVLPRGGQFTGLVTAADGGAPLYDVEVVVRDSQGDWMSSVYTNTSGVYTSGGLASGSYRLEFITDYGTSQDYLNEYYNDKPTLAAADPVALSAPGLTTVDAVLARGGSISGTVTSSLTGGPLNAITVIILDGNGDTVKQTSTDSDGHYLVRGLPTAVYRVHFIYWIPCSSLKYEIYYNQKPTLNTADPVSVTAPNLTPNINAQLPVPAVITLTKCFLPVIER